MKDSASVASVQLNLCSLSESDHKPAGFSVLPEVLPPWRTGSGHHWLTDVMNSLKFVGIRPPWDFCHILISRKMKLEATFSSIIHLVCFLGDQNNQTHTRRCWQVFDLRSACVYCTWLIPRIASHVSSLKQRTPAAASRAHALSAACEETQRWVLEVSSWKLDWRRRTPVKGALLGLISSHSTDYYPPHVCLGCIVAIHLNSRYKTWREDGTNILFLLCFSVLPLDLNQIAPGWL